MKYLILTFDIEEFDLPVECGIKINKEEQLKISFEGTKNILEILEKTNTKATFFVTATFAEKYPELIKKMAQKHEIALHAYKHSHNYSKMNQKDAEKFLTKAKNILEKISKKKITGFRAPRMQVPKQPTLNNIGIKYDSSMHPTYVPGRYNNLLKKRKPHNSNNTLIIPISVTPLIRIPFSFVWFRNIGLTYSKICTRLNLTNSDYTNLYFHPWEFINLTKLEYSNKIPRIMTRNTGDWLQRKLEKYIDWSKKNKIKNITLQEYYETQKNTIKTKQPNFYK